MTSQSDPSPAPADGTTPPPVPPTPAPLAAPTTPPIPGPAPEVAAQPAPPPAEAPPTAAAPAAPPSVAPPAAAPPVLAPPVSPPVSSAPAPYAPPPSSYGPVPPSGTAPAPMPPTAAPPHPAPPQPGMPYAAPYAAPAAPRRKRPVALIIILSLLFVVLLGVIISLAVYLTSVLARLDQAVDRIDELEEIVDSKETFTAAMQELVDTAGAFDGMPYASIIDNDELQQLATQGWESRWQPARVATDVQAVEAKTAELRALLDAAAAEASTNASGTPAEAAIDALGSGFVTTAYDDADSLCESDVLGCVTGADPYVVHLDAADQSLEWMTDYIWTGVAYHEFAHVLQYTNPDETDIAAASFGGDWETMADCFALTYLDGWTLDHRVYVTSYSWYDVSVGYGYTCDGSQRQVVADWYTSLGYTAVPISQ